MALAALMATACGAPAPAGDSLFPLESGRRWVYDVKTEWENNMVEHETRELTALGADSLDDGLAWRRRSDSGVEYWLRHDDTGIYRVASKSDLDALPQPDAQRRFVIKAPVVAGTSWQSTTTAYLLQRRQEFPREIRHTHPAVPMLYTIESTGDAVSTRAGRFSGCVRVRGVATLRLFADPVVGWRDMALTTTEWYCPGVGLVKLVREEPAQSTFLSGGILTMELMQWQ
jgi:hypothetical protein